MNLLIGSRALAYNKPEYGKYITDKTDWDVITFEDLEWAEVHSPNHLYNTQFAIYAHKTPIVHNGVELFPLTLKGLAIIKRSHLWRTIGFNKHITMYHKHIMDGSFEFDDFDRKVLEIRTKMTMESYPQMSPSLKKTKDKFFDDFVIKKFDHDYLHEVVAFERNNPMYKKMQNQSIDSVWCIKEKWDSFTHYEKLKCISEEATVIAFERFLIPKEYDFGMNVSYMMSLDKVCTTLTSGWFRDYAIDHYAELSTMYSKERFNVIKEHLKMIG